MRNKFIIVILLAGFFTLGFAIGRINRKLCQVPKPLLERGYVDIGDEFIHNKALIDFYLKWEQGTAFAAIRQEAPGIDKLIISYLITDNGKLTLIMENDSLCNPYRESSINSIRIGYEDPNGTFIEIDPKKYEGYDLKIIGNQG